MLFESTNAKTSNQSNKVTFKEALLQGQAPDRGLYVPCSIPVWEKQDFDNCATLSYPDIALKTMSAFLGNDIPEEKLREICLSAYDFEVPLQEISDRFGILRLDQGPTASFKDFAARAMARMMSYFIEEKQTKLLILTATSGDTGSAIADAFHNLPGIDVVVMFPKNEVSDRQRKQMTTLGQNIHPVAIHGKFDDCQAFAKMAFADEDLQGLPLTSANSINIGRLIPQMVYYIYAYSRMCSTHPNISFAIPSGNFGNMMGLVFAKKMGLPVQKTVIAVNENDEFPKFLETGSYQKIVPSKACLSNAMNVGHPSNLARLVHLYGGHLDELGNLLTSPDMNGLQNDFFSISISDEETKKTISDVYHQWNCILEPHGAVAWKGAEYFPQENFMVCVETAHPAKFPQTIEDTIGITPQLPPCLRSLDEKKETFHELDATYESVKEFLLSHFSKKD